MGRELFVSFEPPQPDRHVHPANDAECRTCGYVFGRIVDPETGKERGVLSHEVIQRAHAEFVRGDPAGTRGAQRGPTA